MDYLASEDAPDELTEWERLMELALRRIATA
jgi:hypothetical protein